MVFAGRSHPAFARAICGHLGIELGRSSVHAYSNENVEVRVDESVRGADVFVVQTSCPPVNEGVVELLMFIDALKKASADRVTAVMPYFPYARSDKKDKPRICIAAELMARLLTAAGVDRVLTMDLHSPQIQGFFTHIPADQLLARKVIGDYWLTQDLTDHVVVSPDVGHAKESGPFAKRLGLRLAIIDKRRVDDSEQPKPVAMIGDVSGMHCLVFDDEAASGGTLIEGAAFLRQHGALSITASCTHPVLTGKAAERIIASPIDGLVVTDTIPTAGKEFPKLLVLSVAPLFAEAIRSIHDGESVSQLLS